MEALGSASGVAGGAWHPTLHPAEVNDMPSPQCYLPPLGWSLVAGGVLPSGVVAAPRSC